jgi:hypothetical protein
MLPLAPVVTTEEDLREAFTHLFGTEDDLTITSLPTRVISTRSYTYKIRGEGVGGSEHRIAAGPERVVE